MDQNTIFTNVATAFEASNGKIASLFKLEGEKLVNKLLMLAAAEMEKSALLPKEAEAFKLFIDKWINGNKLVKSITADTHPMSILPDTVKVTFTRKNNDCINLLIHDDTGVPQYIMSFNQNGPYAKKLMKKMNMDFSKLII